MKPSFNTGSIEKDRDALRITIEGGYPLGDLVVGSDDVPRLLAGTEVDIRFVQQRGRC